MVRSLPFPSLAVDDGQTPQQMESMTDTTVSILVQDGGIIYDSYK